MALQIYHSQKGLAKVRGIEFKLTFEEWLKIWIDSGHLHERGRGIGKYCMARFNDKGAYEVGNVKIILFTENLREKVISQETRKKLADNSRKRLFGKFLSAAHRARISSKRRGKKHSVDTISVMSEKRKLWWEERKNRNRQFQPQT